MKLCKSKTLKYITINSYSVTWENGLKGYSRHWLISQQIFDAPDPQSEKQIKTQLSEQWSQIMQKEGARASEEYGAEINKYNPNHSEKHCGRVQSKLIRWSVGECGIMLSWAVLFWQHETLKI